MKIAFFTLLRGRNWGGSENLWFKTAILALKSGHEVLIVAESSLESEKLSDLKNQGADFFYLKHYLTSYKERILQLFSPSFAEKKFLRNLSDSVNHFDPDLMVINQPGCYDLAFNKTIADFLKLTTKKYTLSFHSYTNQDVLKESEKIIMGDLLKQSSANFFVAKKQAKTILQQLEIDLVHSSYIFNPLNLNDKSPVPYPQTKTAKLVMVSSLDMNWKGHDIILNILAEPKWMKEDWSLSIFGDGPDLEKINTLIVKLGLKDRVSLKGHARDIREVWATHQILLMPSRVDAAPAVLLEAMACGRTAVCSNIGFVEHWIEDNVSGFIADISLYESAFERAWSKRENWEKMGRLAKEKMSKDFPEEPEKEYLQQLMTLVELN